MFNIVSSRRGMGERDCGQFTLKGKKSARETTKYSLTPNRSPERFTE